MSRECFLGWTRHCRGHARQGQTGWARWGRANGVEKGCPVFIFLNTLHTDRTKAFVGLYAKDVERLHEAKGDVMHRNCYINGVRKISPALPCKKDRTTNHHDFVTVWNLHNGHQFTMLCYTSLWTLSQDVKHDPEGSIFHVCISNEHYHAALYLH